MFLKKIPHETSLSDKEFLLNCIIGTEKEFENLNNSSWTITNKQQNNIESKNAESYSKPFKDDSYNNKFVNSSNILAYNNNVLDKMILVHVYQQKFGEVFQNIVNKN